jgi:amino acid adenylation domain-containing protein
MPDDPDIASAQAIASEPLSNSSTGTRPLNTEERADFPCSKAQERFWLLDRLQPGNPSFNVAVRWRLEGHISITLLERAWRQIIERHEILRTVFPEINGEATQRVLPSMPFKLTEIDLSKLDDDAQGAEGDRIGVIEAREPFDLETGPLIRVTLLRYSPSVAVVLITSHQVVSDGWSIGVMAREMGLLYDSLSRDATPSLDELPIQYADFSLWQLEWLRARGTNAEELYWGRQLAGVKPFSVVPDHPRPAVPTTNGAIASLVLPRNLTDRAQVLCAERGATLFAAALAALCATLCRYTGEEEIVLGTQVSDRDQVELESMIGQFVTSLVLRNDLSGNPTFGELVDRVWETISQALEHRHIPIETLLGMVKAERREPNTPAISVNFIFQKTFIQNTTYRDFALIDMPSLPAGAIYDLNFFMVERLDGWRFSCQYNTDQFEAATANRLLKYFQTLLQSSVGNPGLHLSELRLDDTDELASLIQALNATDAAYPRNQTAAHLFEAQAKIRPDATAVLFGSQELSYGHLNQIADRIAQSLIDRSVKAGTRVGICLEPSAHLVATVLAILKIGAIYVPLNSEDPPARLAALLASAECKAVITGSKQLQHLPAESATGFDVAALIERNTDKSMHTATVTSDPNAEMALLFTSGPDAATSGVRVSHSTMVNLACALRTKMDISAQDTILATIPFTHFLATAEILLPLTVGARLIIPSERDLKKGHRLSYLVEHRPVSAMFALSSAAAHLLASGFKGGPKLKLLVASDGFMSRQMAEQLLLRAGSVWALTGFPETADCAAIWSVSPHQDAQFFGAPIANTRCYVLDRAGNIAPIGATGVLAVAGTAVSLGYLNRPEVERAHFAPEPGRATADCRMFRTGMLARLRKGGEVELLGRVDRQFWRNNVRVDPGEIEAALLRLNNVADAAVICVPAGPKHELAIVGFVVPKVSSEQLPADAWIRSLQGGLAAVLPAHMCPDFLTVQNSIPSLNDGRVNYKALHIIASAEAPATFHSIEHSDAERHLERIWSAMLGADKVAPTDNFFEIGGHSLLAARMLTKVHKDFGRRITIAALFRAPTIRELAKVLDEPEAREFDFRQVVKLQPFGSKPTLIAINNTGNYYALAKCLGPDQPVTSLQLFDPSVKTVQMPHSLEEIAAGYVELLRRVQPQGPYMIMGWCVAGALAFEIACQLERSHKSVSHLFLMDSWVPGYFRRLPVLRRAIAERSLRWQFVLDDWRGYRAGQQRFSDFLNNRHFVKRLRKWAGVAGPVAASEKDDGVELGTPEDYDLWLLHHLQAITGRYEPKQFGGMISLFRSQKEPTGWFFDPLAGWARFATRGVTLHMISGNHFTMFQAPGVEQMAQAMSAVAELAPLTEPNS